MKNYLVNGLPMKLLPEFKTWDASCLGMTNGRVFTSSGIIKNRYFGGSIRPGNMSEYHPAVVMPGHSAFVMPRYEAFRYEAPDFPPAAVMPRNEASHYEVPEMLRLYSDQYSKHVLFCYAKSRPPAVVMPRHEASRFE